MKKKQPLGHFRSNVRKRSLKSTPLTFLLFFLSVFNLVAKGECRQGEISVKCCDASLKDTHLDDCLQHKVVAIHKEELKLESLIQQKKHRIQGKVSDEKGNPLPGVSVMVKESTIGVATDADGNYSLEFGGNDVVLVFSFIGMISREIKYEGQHSLHVVLKEDTEQVDEVVVTGYQTINKERMTGSATAITAASIKNIGFTSIEEALEGNISGMNMLSTGRPGEDAKIEIRGVNSFTGNTNPLWIVDGMPMMGAVPEVSDGNELRAQVLTSGIGNISPEDIESITVLKDAAAAAIYGAQAANGVIVVTTKSGHAGKTFFNLTSNFSITERPNPDLYMMNSEEKIRFEKAYYYDWGERGFLGRAADVYQALESESISATQANAILQQLKEVDTDWFKEIFSNAVSQQHSLSMSGGNEKTQYYVSGHFLSEDGIEPNNQFDRLGLNMKITHQPGKKVRITVGLASNLRNTTQSASVINPLRYAIYANPYEKPYNADGTYAYDLTYAGRILTSSGDDYFRQLNAIEDLERNTTKSHYISSDMNLKLEYEFLPGLTYSLQGAYNINSNNSSRSIIAGTYTDYRTNWHPNINSDFSYELLQGSLKENSSHGNEYTFRNTIQYMKEFMGGHYVNLFGGQEIRSVKSNTSSHFFPTYDEEHRIGGYPDLDAFDANELDLYKLGGTGYYENKLSSFFFNALYSYNDRYILSGSLRYDGSTFIGNKNQFTPLWNISGRWNLHREAFLNHDIISLLALRAGYGFTGSIDRNASPYSLLYFSSAAYKYDGMVLPSSISYPSKNLKWQTKKDRNIGFELGLWNNKFQFGMNYFNNITKDVLDQKKLSISSGRDGIRANVASILNKGWEFDLTTTLYSRNDLTCIAMLNLSILDDEILDSYYANLNEVSSVKQQEFVKGYPVKAWFGYKFHSINPADGHVYAYDDEGNSFDMNMLYNTSLDIEQPGLRYLGDQTPSYYGGLSASIKYKQFSVRIASDFKGGHKILSFGANDKYTSSKNKPSFLNSAWTQPGDVTIYPAIDYLSSPMDKYMFDSKLEDGDYFRINLVSLGYLFKTESISNLGLQSARLNFNVRNVAVFSKYKGIDPSLMGALNYPNTCKYLVSLNLGF